MGVGERNEVEGEEEGKERFFSHQPIPVNPKSNMVARERSGAHRKGPNKCTTVRTAMKDAFYV